MSRKQVIVLIFVSMMIASSVQAANETPAATLQPQAFLPESVYEFNPVVEGQIVTHEFALHNRGDADLRILEIKSG